MIDDDLQEMLTRPGRDREEARVFYQLLVTGKRLQDALIGEIRCKSEGCQLLQLFYVPGSDGARVGWYSKRYRRSRTSNEATSSPAGRAANTEDGDRRWKPRYGYVGVEGNFALNCNHVDVVIDQSELPIGRPGTPAKAFY